MKIFSVTNRPTRCALFFSSLFTVTSSIMPLQQDNYPLHIAQALENRNLSNLSTNDLIILFKEASYQKFKSIIQEPTLSKNRTLDALATTIDSIHTCRVNAILQAHPDWTKNLACLIAPKICSLPTRMVRHIIAVDPTTYDFFIDAAQNATDQVPPSTLIALIKKSPHDTRLSICMQNQINYLNDYREKEIEKILSFPSIQFVFFKLYIEDITNDCPELSLPSSIINFCRHNSQAKDFLKGKIKNTPTAELSVNLLNVANAVEPKMLLPHLFIPLPNTHTGITALTQSQSHFKKNIQLILSQFGLNALARKNISINTMLSKITVKEQEEISKGRYVFFHAQQWRWHLLADLFEKLWEMVYQEQISDYQFLRFKPKPDEALLQQENALRRSMMDNGRTNDNRPDLLFMNHALFGNSGNAGSCSLSYFLKNSDLSCVTISAADLFSAFHLNALYKKYAKKLDNLERLHAEANEHNHGNMLLISCTPDQLESSIFSAHPGGAKRTVSIDTDETNNVATILDTLKADPSAIYNVDGIEYCMTLTQDLVLDPQKGPRIYSFNTANPTTMEEYYTLRDAIFAEIETEYRATNPQPVFLTVQPLTVQPLTVQPPIRKTVLALLKAKMNRGIVALSRIMPDKDDLKGMAIGLVFWGEVAYLAYAMRKDRNYRIQLKQENQSLKTLLASLGYTA